MGIVLLQLVIQSAPAEQGPALLLGIFPVHLPQEEGPELGPEVEALDAVIPEHGGVPLEPVQQLPGVGVAADHPGHLQVEGVEQGHLQQKAADVQVEAAIDGRLEIEEALPKGLGHNVRAEGRAPGHVPGRDGHTQGIADGLL